MNFLNLYSSENPLNDSKKEKTVCSLFAKPHILRKFYISWGFQDMLLLQWVLLQLGFRIHDMAILMVAVFYLYKFWM